MGGNAPCYKCEMRYAGCHAKCVKYMDFVQKCEVEREKVRMANTVDRLNYDSRKHYMKNPMRNKRRWGE